MKTETPSTPFADLLMDKLCRESGFINGEIVALYHTMFTILGKDVLEISLTNAYGDYIDAEQTESSWWFTAFHKSMRQTDFYGEAYIMRPENLLTKEETAELKQLQNKINGDWNSKNEAERERLNIEYGGRLTWASIIHRDDYIRCNELKRKRNNKGKKPISGQLDSLLWNLIHVDQKNLLMKAMITTFKLYEANLAIKHLSE